MRDFKDTLAKSYEREKRCYKQILKLAEELHAVLSERRPVSEIIPILKNKNRLMREIESIEELIVEEKKLYRDVPARPADVARIIDEISSLIEKVLAVERKNEILFSTGGRSVSRSREVANLAPEAVMAKYGSLE